MVGAFSYLVTYLYRREPRLEHQTRFHLALAAVLSQSQPSPTLRQHYQSTSAH